MPGHDLCTQQRPKKHKPVGERMAYVDQFARHSGNGGLRQRLSRLLETPFDRRYRLRMREIAMLRATSDEDLAAMGLAREDIAAHVFGTRFSGQ